MFSQRREAVRVKVKKYEAGVGVELQKFSVDPQLTSLEVLHSILAKAFNLSRPFTISYRVCSEEGPQALLSDWDLDNAFLRAQNVSSEQGSEPCVLLRVEVRPEGAGEAQGDEGQRLRPHQKQAGLQGIFMNQMEKTFSMVSRALNLSEEVVSAGLGDTARPPLSDAEFRSFLDPVGQLVQAQKLREVVYQGGIDPSLRRVVWKHILNVYPAGMSGKQRMDYMKRKSAEYTSLKRAWRDSLQKGQVSAEVAYVTSMVKKDVLRTDRHHKFYAGSDDNQNVASLFNMLTTYALNHPGVSYCQGMSDLASPLLVTMGDEAHAYICLCALLQRLRPAFLLDGEAMTLKFSHLTEALQLYDKEFYGYLKSHQADDLLFCYRWLLLEMKREFAFDDSLRMLEVLWSSLPPAPPKDELPLKESSPPSAVTPPATSVLTPRETAYSKLCAMRRHHSAVSLLGSGKRLYRSVDGSVSSRKLLGGRDHCSLDGVRPTSPSQTTRLSSTTPEESTSPAPRRLIKSLGEFRNLGSTNPFDTEIVKTEGEEGSDSSPDDSREYSPMTTSVTRELAQELESLDRRMLRAASPTPLQSVPIVEPSDNTEDDCRRDDVFIWENPLHGKSPGENDKVVNDLSLIANGNIPRNDATSSTCQEENLEQTVSGTDVIRDMQQEKTEAVSSTREEKKAPPHNSKFFSNMSLELENARKNCEMLLSSRRAVGSVQTVAAVVESFQRRCDGAGSLPPPETFGGGNPFLMFLCLSVLLQHRDHIMRNHMDYNELAMHFDKMVRRHNVDRVLGQARRMYQHYLQLQLLQLH